MLFSIEGPDCSGKTTVIKELKKIFSDAIFIREPGTTLFGENIREILLNSDYCLESLSELLLFTSSFCETSMKVIEPSKERNNIIIADRWYYSTIAYQCFATNKNEEYLIMQKLISMNCISKPDINFILIPPWDIIKYRLSLKVGPKDNFERRDEEYQKKIYKYYDEVCEGIKINSDCPIEELVSFIEDKIKKH
jgi:dTMP kinase